MKTASFSVINLKARLNQIIIGIGFFVALVELFIYLLPPAVDWHAFYRPAALALVEGRTPFEIYGYMNAPWVLIPFIPLLIFPENVGRAILAVACLISVIIVARKFEAKPLALIFLLLSPPVMQMMLDGNIDWLVLFGFILPPQIGLFFVSIKPQVGIGVFIFWAYQAFRKGGLKEIIRVFAPFTLVFTLSILVYGFWFVKIDEAAWGGNASLWPVSLPIGMVLLYKSFKNMDISPAIAASPCLTPYILLHSYIGLFVAFCRQTTEIVIAVIGLWLVVIIRGMGY